MKRIFELVAVLLLLPILLIPMLLVVFGVLLTSRGCVLYWSERVGRGNVISFVDNPNFRGTWFGTNKLFFNAIFFGGVINGNP